MMVLVGTLSFNFQVLLPLLASADVARHRRDLRDADGGDGRRLRARRAGSPARAGASRRGCSSAAPRCSASPSCSPRSRPRSTLQALALVPLGAASVTFAAGVNSSLQLAAEPMLRGRVMALYAIVFLGSTRDRRAADRLARPGRRPAQRALTPARRGALARRVPRGSPPRAQSR